MTLGNYGGGTPTFPLLPGSTAIDAGDDTVCAADPVNGQDQRGVARPQGAHCDIGAFESRGFTLTKAGGDNQSTPISTTFTLPLSVTLSETGGNALSGASITFAAPNSGASLANPTTTVLTTNAAGSAARTATANGLTGSYTVTASAPGAVSATFALTNLKGTSNTSVTSSPNPSTFGQAVTFTVTVTSTAGTPTGNITFTLDTTNITQPLVNGVATYVTNTLALGTHAAIAAYGGDANYTESTSSVYPHTVNKFSTTTNVTSAPNPSVSGHPVMITATVTSASGTPTGNITFTIGTANIVQPLVNGLATYVTNTLGLGATPITATYGGDADYNGSVSNNYTHFVDPTLIVTTDADSGPRSLRQAISDALPGDTVTFAGDYTITLSSTLTIAKDLTIDGVGHAITMDGNHAVGVFALNSGTITLNRLNIVNGYLVGTAFPWTSGGGISVDGATLNLSNSTFSGNVTGPLGGGALHLQRGTVNITNSVFISNSSSLGGGAIESESGTTLNVANSTFHGNTATNGGGGIYNSGSSNLTLTNVTFFSNTAQWGGGMYNLTSDPMLTNVTFSANSADQGGGMFNIVSRPLLTNVTFSGNSAAQGGGGMYNTSSRPSMRNSLFWGDSGGEILNIYYTAAISDSVVQGGCPANSTCTNIISADPLLGTLGNYTCPGGQCQGGGSTATIPLLPGSSAIDAGNGAYCTVGSDQRGKNYVGLCDIGAFESQGFTLGALTGTPQSTLINTAFAQPLGLSVTSAFSEPVAGGVISFTAPTSGASLAAPTTFTKTIGASGPVSATVVANGTSGSYTVTASARGATSINFALTNKWVTTTTLTSSPNPSTLGQAVTFTATVTAAVGTPTGSITFTLDATTLTVPLDANGQAAYITNTLSLGNHLVSAAYGGDANFNASSGVLSGGQTVTDVPITNLSAVNSSPTRLRNLTYFTATTGTGSNVTYQWNLGNGHLANGATTSYTYPLTGTYTAIVTATNNFGFSTATTLVAIEPIRVFLPLILK
jgi:predicted outer membrane repeat protein